MRRSLAPCLVVLLASCESCEEEPLQTLSTVLDGSAGARVEVTPTVGEAGIVRVPIRLLNAWGAAVPGGDVEVRATGPTATSPSTVSPDAFGYGLLEVTTAGPEAVTVEVVAAPGGATAGEPAAAWVVGGALHDLSLGEGWDPGINLPPRYLAGVTGGVLAADDHDVWWVPGAAGQPAHRVLALTGAIEGLDALHVDMDGVLDAIVRTEDEVILLRGRREGGMAWGAGFAAEGRTVHGAGAGDVDGDGISDVVLVLAGDDGDLIDAWAGDGAWGFEALDQGATPYPAADAILADSTGDGLFELDVLTATAMLYRYSRDAEGWTETYPSSVETNLEPPATFVGAADLEGGGWADLVVMAAEAEGTERGLLLYVMEDGPVRYNLSFDDPWPALGDLNGDGVTDLVVGEGDHLVSVAWETAQETDTGDVEEGFMRRKIADVPGDGPLALLDADTDDIADVIVASSAFRLHRGGVSEGPWAAREAPWVTLSTWLLSTPEPVALGGDPATPGLVAFVDDDGVTELIVWRIVPPAEGEAAPRLEVVDAVTLQAGALPLDLAVCGERAFGLVDAGTAVAIRFDASGVEETGRVAAKGYARVACGPLADGAVAAFTMPDGTAMLVDEALSAVGAAALGSLGDVAAADSDGDGVADLITCASDGCGILAADVDGDGADEVFTVEGGLLTDLATGGAEAGAGDLAAADLDGDGRLEIVTGAPDRIGVHRPVEGGLAPGLDWYFTKDLVGPVRFVDWNGDGVQDLLAPGDQGILYLLSAGSAP